MKPSNCYPALRESYKRRCMCRGGKRLEVCRGGERWEVCRGGEKWEVGGD